MRPIKNAATKTFMLLALSAFLFSFIPFGTDTFQIYVDKKLVMDQSMYKYTSIKNLQLDPQNPNGLVEVYYNHCGRIGQARHLQVRDGNDRLLKEWVFADGNGPKDLMSCRVKDLLDLQKANGKSQLNLYYSSKELPKGQHLVSIGLSNSNKTTP
jgi:hypothetical protein